MIVSEIPRWEHRAMFEWLASIYHCDGNAEREQLRTTALHWAALAFGWSLGGGNVLTIALFDCNL